MHILKKFIRPLEISAAFFFLVTLSLGCSSYLSGVDYNIDGPPSYGDAIVEASIADATTLIPIVASDSASHSICALVYNGLVKYDKDLNIVGELAEGWDIEEGGLVIVFHLRKDVRWHDGKPFTAEDVKFTYERLIDPKVRTPYGGDFLKIRSLDVLDPYTVKVRYKEPFSPALSSWGMWIMPKHLLEGEDLNTTSYGRRPVGTGPYKFSRWKTGERIDLVSNKDYFDGRPFIDRYIYRIIPDAATMFLELETEGIDMMGLDPLQYRRQTDNRFFKSCYNKFRYPSFGYTYLGYNLLDKKFKDKRVRKALNLAVNKSELIDGVLMGLGEVCTGPFVPESWAYNKDIRPSAYDPKAAEMLLAEAGWIDTDGDGLLDKDGEPFSFTILTNQGNDLRRRAAVIIQHRLSEIGVKVKIKVVEWSVFLTEFINKKRFETILLAWGLGRDPDCYDIWHSSKTRQGEFNFIGYKNNEVDRLLEEGRRVFDQQRRAQIYHKVQKILYEDQPYMFLWVADSLPIVHKRFKNVKPAPAGIGYNFIRWYVPKDQQKYKQ
ncbi:MAG: peptide-binding protein [Candidatus Omnitrophica bacterium]|nr:peptide-binding protein [Candidatus Omnitrophota bacterium]